MAGAPRMSTVAMGVAATVLLALPPAAAGQGADQGYGGVLGDERLVQQPPAPAPPPPAVPAPEVPVVDQAPIPELDVPLEQAPAPEVPVPVSEVPTTAPTPPSERAGGLPVTGSDILPLTIGGLVLLAMGLALRRRSYANT